MWPLVPWRFEVHPMDFLGEESQRHARPQKSVFLALEFLSISIFHWEFTLLKTSADLKVDYFDGNVLARDYLIRLYSGSLSNRWAKLLVFKELRLWNTDFLWSSFKSQFCHYKLTDFGIHFASQGLSPALKWVQVCGSLWCHLSGCLLGLPLLTEEEMTIHSGLSHHW